MVVGSHVLAPRDSLEAVQVQLPLEGLDPGVSEVPPKNLAGEPLVVEHLEGGSVADPPYDLGILMLQDGK